MRLTAADDPVGAVFHALSDPARRHVVEMLVREPGATQRALAAELPITRQAVAKHLRSLDDAGLVRAQRHGRETRYELAPAALSPAAAWMAAVGSEWDQRLDGLAAALARRGTG